MQHKSVWIRIAVVLLLTALAASYFLQRKPSFRGAVIDPPIPAAEIRATDMRGNAFQMSALRGKVVLLYFGFVNCPHECPLTMAHIKQALEALGETSKDVAVVMVSTDPKRDTPQAMRDFLGKFNPTFIGVTGKPDELLKIWKDYAVVVLDGGETHSSYTYVIDRNGKERLTFVPDTAPEDITHDLKILLAE